MRLAWVRRGEGTAERDAVATSGEIILGADERSPFHYNDGLLLARGSWGAADCQRAAVARAEPRLDIN